MNDKRSSTESTTPWKPFSPGAGAGRLPLPLRRHKFSISQGDKTQKKHLHWQSYSMAEGCPSRTLAAFLPPTTTTTQNKHHHHHPPSRPETRDVAALVYRTDATIKTPQHLTPPPPHLFHCHIYFQPSGCHCPNKPLLLLLFIIITHTH